MRAFLLVLVFAFYTSGYAEDTLSCSGKMDADGKKHGVWICKNTNGRLVKKERYKHGKLSTWILYNNKGQMIETRNKKGIIRKYSPCGC